MGLDAVVFRNAAKLAKTYNVEVVAVDGQTGEPQVADRDLGRLPPGALVAVRHRLGNLDDVATLREAVTAVLADTDSIIANKVLYSASHSGDVIATTDIPKTRRELAILMAAADRRLDSLVSQMHELLDASEAQQNPIVFV